MGTTTPQLDLLASGPKVLILDIETVPATAYVWGTNKQYVSIDKIIEPGHLLCFAAKWANEKHIHFHSIQRDGHEAMVRRAWQFLDEADIIVGWNSRPFDIKYIHAEIVKLGLRRPRRHHDMDLLPIVRKHFRWESNRLDYVARMLGCPLKVKHTGFDLWRDVMAGDEKAWRLMQRYNKGDVLTTECVFNKLYTWITPFPHQGLFGGNSAGCPRCGSLEVQQDGYTPKTTGRFASYICLKCDSQFDGTHAVQRVHHRAW